jgi:hypothetical protein
MSDREDKVSWMESQECPTCWGAKKRKEEAEIPITATVTLLMNHQEDGTPIVQIALSGGTERHKEEIKNLGYNFGEIGCGVFGLLSMNRVPVQWHKIIPYDKVGSELETIKGIAQKIENNATELDLELARNRYQEKKKKDEKIAAIPIPKPQKPTCYPAGNWNGKIYGSDKYGYRIYIDGVEKLISKNDAAAITTYQKEMSRYQEEVKKIQ